jgi:hypothetical protein
VVPPVFDKSNVRVGGSGGDHAGLSLINGDFTFFQAPRLEEPSAATRIGFLRIFMPNS